MGRRILVVEDEPDILRLIEIKLKRAGFEVLTARDGEEGLALALAERPDVLLCDVMIPKRDGYSVVSEVKRQLGAGAPISILLTARGQQADIAQGRDCGSDDYILKPFSPSELVKRLNGILARAGDSSPTSA